MVMSTKFVGITDPHRRLQCIRQKGETMPAGEIKTLRVFFKHQGHASCLSGVFGMTAETSNYDATLFRFPLRQPDSESRISQNCYTPDSVRENLFSSLKTEAPILLLFLKHVRKVSTYEWNETDDCPECKFSVEISDSIEYARSECNALAQEYTKSSSDATAVLTSATTCTCDEDTKDEYHWLIINSIGSDVVELRERADNIKVLPWVGIAAQVPMKFELTGQEVSLQNISQIQNIKTAASILSQLLTSHSCEAAGLVDGCTSGQAFCFLPIPGSIALPVNLHGYFAVADNRRSIKWPSHDEKGEEAKWNKILLEKLIAPLYSLLLMCRSSLIQYHGTSIDECTHDAYAAWPVYAEVKNQKIWSEILEPVLARIVDLPILWTEACDGDWVTPREAFFLNPDESYLQVAIQILVESGYKVVRLPDTILETMLTNKKMKTIVRARFVTAELVQNGLRNNKGILDSVPREQVYQLLEYILSYIPHQIETDVPDHSVLNGIEILPLDDSNALCQFAPHSGYNTVFVFPERYKNALEFLPGIGSVVVDTEISFSLQSKLEELAREGQLQLRLATPAIICGQLLKQSMTSWCLHLGNTCIWQPGQGDHPLMGWIENIWLWIRTHNVPLHVIFGIPIVPGEVVNPTTEQVCLFPLNTSPPLCTLSEENLPQQCPLDLMLNIVRTMGLVHIQESKYVSQCPGTNQYIKTCDAPFLISKMKNPSSFAEKLTSTEKDALRHFIARDYHTRRMSSASREINSIKSLQIFQAGVGGTPFQYISLNSVNCILPPREITFEPDIEYLPNILIDEGGQVTALLRVLHIERISTIDEFCKRIILPHATQKYLSATESDKLIMWVLQLPLTTPKFLKSFKIIQPCVSSRLRKKPADLFDPEDEILCSLFDSQREDVFPNDRYKPVLSVLRQAGMKTWASLRKDPEKMLEFLVERAKTVSSLFKSDGLARSKCLLSHLPEMRLITDSSLSKINFLFPEETPPSDYPAQLKWYGKDNSQATSPQNLCCNSSHACFVGSVLPILSLEYELQKNYPGFHKMSGKDIVSHFKQVVSFVSTTELTESDVDKVHDIVMKIYRMLSTAKSLTDFPQQWIWWKSRRLFLTPEQCVLRVPEDILTLEPFLFSLSANPELQTRVSALLPLLPQVKLKLFLCTEDAVAVLNKMNQFKGRILEPEKVNLAVRILQWLKNQDYNTHGDILIPTASRILAAASECTYDDRDWIRTKTQTQQLSKYTFVHEDISQALAQHFHVTPLSQRVAPSQKLELKLQYTRAGQHEPITRRIKRIVEDYATSSDILKELLQNADDAEATEVKFLIDWREHPASSLLNDELKVWQGPALVAYNNSVFSDQDFEHICELAAETKMKDPLKTGRFGVGFCATYHMTDLPSFVSRHLFTMFDPHTNYLGERVSAGEPGMRIDLVKNQENLRVYADQFQPYNGLFGCNIFALPKRGFEGTLFRFPFRNLSTARKSKISREVNDRRSVERLLQHFKEQASHLLLFLKHVRKVSISVLEKGARTPSEMVTIVDVEKTCECAVPYGCNRLRLISTQGTASKYSDNRSECHCTIKTRESRKQPPNTTEWIISSSIDTKAVLHKGDGEQRGLIPFAEIGIRVEKSKKSTLLPLSIEGYTFCFLPLPIKTELPFHVNGFFDVGQDRASLKSSDDERFGKEWNEFLCRGALMQAFIAALSTLAQMLPFQQTPNKESKEKDLNAYYNMFRLSEKKGLIGQTLCTSVKKGLPESTSRLVWSDVNGGQWVLPKEVVLLDIEISAEKMYEATIAILLELEYKICEIPYNLKRLLIDFLKKTSTRQVYTYHSFCTNVLMPNLQTINIHMRDQHILFLLKNMDRFKWIYALMRKQRCIPVEGCAHLVLPSYVIDDTAPLLKSLYGPEEGRFPAEFLRDSRAMISLSQLGMVRQLSVEDIKDRAHTVKKIQGSERAAKRAWTLLQYIQKQYIPRHTYAVSKNKELCEILSTIPFLPVVPKPSKLNVPRCEADLLVTPQSVCTPDCNNLVFSKRPVVEQPHEYQLRTNVLALIGSSQNPPLEEVISHLLCLSQNSKCFDEDTLPFIAEVTDEIYKYLQRKLVMFPSDSELEKDIAMTKKLQGSEFIWQDNKFLKTDQVVLKWDRNCYPYLCELSSANKKYQKLFELLGIKVEPSLEELAHILRRIAGIHPTPETTDPKSMLADTDTKITEPVLNFIEEIVKKMSGLIKAKKIDPPPPHLYLPDDTCVMRPVKQLACDKPQNAKDDRTHSLEMFKSQFEDGVCHFIHPSIARERAITLGVKPLLDALLQGIEDDNFMKGIDYGQYENLCDRLQSILRKYPTDCSILNEFIQNADDAQATEIVFVLDHRKFPQDKIFQPGHKNWKALQHTPALCILNNRKFSEDDIIGLSQLGRGGKRDSSDAIGRFGIGFSVAYHVTDCPSFVSFSEAGEPENYCAFDPTCRFVPNTNKLSPGKRWILNPGVVTDMSDQFQPYLIEELSKHTPNSLLGELNKGYVVFRLPLTRQQSTHDTTASYAPHYGYGPRVTSYEGKTRTSYVSKTRTPLSHATFDIHKVSRLLEQMKEYAGDTLLFLNHVKKMSAFEIKENGKCTMYFSTQSSMSPEDLSKCHTFARTVNEMTKRETEQTSLKIAHKTEITNEVSVRDEHKMPATKVEKIQWLVHRRYEPPKKKQNDTAVDAQSHKAYAVQEGRKYETDVLELNMRPLGGVAAAIGRVDMDGRFFCFLPMPLKSRLPVHVNGHFLVDDSRKHLERVHTNWNKSLASNVIAPCYVELIMHAQEMTSKHQTDPKWLYSLFPNLSSTGEVGDLRLAKEVYKILLDKNPKILLQRQPGNVDIFKWFHLKGSDMGYFFRSFTSQDTEKVINADPDLQSALISLGMAIATNEVPHDIYGHMSKVDEDYSTAARVDPHKVIDHLKRVSFSRRCNIMKNATIQLLLRFVIDGMTVDDLKEAIRSVPLLISYDGCLWKGKELYQSAYAALLPCKSAYFVDKKLEESSVGKTLAKEEYGVIVELPVTFVASHIALSDTMEAVKINDLPFEDIQLIKHLWKYVNGLLSSRPFSATDTLEKIFWKPLLPTDDGHLYPLYLSQAIICSVFGNRQIRSTLRKLGYPTIRFEALNITEPCTSLGNQCSDGRDLIKCFTTKAPLKCDADLNRDEVRVIMEHMRQHSLMKVAGILRTMKIFETVDGLFITMQDNPKVYVMPHGIPKDGICQIQNKTSCVILKGADRFTMQFYNSVLPNLSAENALQFYKHVILPNMQELETKALQVHLRHIRFEELKKDKSVMRALRQTKIMRLEEGIYSITEVCNPSDVFFKNFCSNRLLPDPWKAELDEWLPFLKEIGLRDKVNFEEWIEHAKSFAADHQRLPMHTIIAKSNALLDSLFKIIEEKLSTSDEFEFQRQLQETSGIRFICNTATSSLFDLVGRIFRNRPQRKLEKTLFCFKGSVMSAESDLTALCRNILPQCCDETLNKQGKLRNLLGIESPIKATTIERNLIMLSELYTCLQHRRSGTDTDELRRIMLMHYAAFNTIRGIKNCIDTKKLRETLCIAVSPKGTLQSLVLVKPSQLVMSLPSDICLEPFCYAVPRDITQHTNFLKALGIADELSASSCARILTMIHQELEQVNRKLSSDDTYKRVALDAYRHMVCTLRQREEQLPSNFPLPSEDDDLFFNVDLLHNDAPWYAQRLPQDEAFHFLKLPPPDDKGEKVPPASLGITKLTEVISEELHKDIFSSDCACTCEERYAKKMSTVRCSFVKNLHDTLNSDHLKDGLLRVYFHDYRVKPSTKFVDAVTELRTVKVKCVTSPAVVTVLVKDRNVIQDTKCDDKNCHVSADGNITIAPHGQFILSQFMRSLSSGIRMLLHNEIKNEAHILAMLECQPHEIPTMLDQQHVSLYNPNDIKETKYRQVGETISLDTFSLENCLITLNYKIGEKVSYQNSNGAMVIADVTSIDDSEEIKDIWEKTITLKISVKDSDSIEQNSEELEDVAEVVAEFDEVQVSPFSIFKFLTPSQQITLFSDSSNSTKATAEPVCLADIPTTEDELSNFLEGLKNSLFFFALSETGEAIAVMRLISHLHYTLVREQGKNHLLTKSAASFLQQLTDFLSPSYFDENSAQTILHIATDLSIPTPTYSCSVQTDTYSFGDHHSSPHVSGGSPYVSSAPQPRSQPLASAGHYYHHPRFHPQQRRGRQSLQRHRFQPEVQSQAPPPPPVSDESAQMWLHQAKTDYKAAFFLMGAMTITPTVVAPPHACEVQIAEAVVDEFQDSEELKEPDSCTYSDEDFLSADQEMLTLSSEEAESSDYEMQKMKCSVDREEESSDDETQPTKSSVDREEESSDDEVLPTKCRVDREEESSDDEVLPTKSSVDREEESSDDGVRQKGSSLVRGSVSDLSSPQFPALVCYLCHEAVEKCLKGVMYAYCGLKPDLLNCSTLVSLYEDLKRSPHCPQNLIKPIEQCVMQVNEHENKSHLPNYQIPHCAPATVYTAINANEAFLATRKLFQCVQGDPKVALLLGDLEELPKPKFTSTLRSQAGTDGKLSIMYSHYNASLLSMSCMLVCNYYTIQYVVHVLL